MNVLLVSTNRSRHPLPVIPYGACIVAESAERAGHRVRLMDLMFEPRPLEAFVAALRRTRPDVVGISVRNIDNNDIIAPRRYARDTLPVVDAVRRHSDAEIVLGGAAVTVMPEQFLRATGVRWAVPGNGEWIFPAFLHALGGASDPRTVPGVAILDRDGYRVNPAPRNLVEEASFPDFRRWVDIRAYTGGMASAPVQTRRGCPFRCVYCTYAISEGRNYRLFDTERIVSGIRSLADAGFRDIEFVDNVFNSPYEPALALCQALAEARLGVRYHTVEVSPAFLDDRLLKAMERAGFAGIGLTPESADDRVLRGLGKPYTSREVDRAARVASRHEVPCLWLFLLGGPGETRDSVQRTIEFAERRVRKTDTAFFNIGLRIYPGTPLEAIARRQGVLRDSRDSMLDPAFYIAPGIERDWLIDTVRETSLRVPHIIGPETFSLPFLPGVLRMLQRLGVTPPAWKHTARLRRGFSRLGIRT